MKSGGKLGRMIAALAALTLMAAPAAAQVRTVDPNDAIDRDLAPTAVDGAVANPPAYSPPPPSDNPPPPSYSPPPPTYSQSPPYSPPPAPVDPATPPIPTDNTYNRDDVIGAAERTFGKGAAGLAEILEKTLKDQGRPNAYIAGSEGSGAVVVGLRYGSGTISHKIEGERKVHWAGPSVGFDVGGDANKVFMLVYNLHDTEELYKRFPAGEGRLYFIGGFAATYLRWKNIVVIPIRLGVGYRAGVNAGYLKFTKKGTWIPF